MLLHTHSNCFCPHISLSSSSCPFFSLLFLFFSINASLSSPSLSPLPLFFAAWFLVVLIPIFQFGPRRVNDIGQHKQAVFSTVLHSTRFCCIGSLEWFHFD